MPSNGIFLTEQLNFESNVSMWKSSEKLLFIETQENKSSLKLHILFFDLL